MGTQENLTSLYYLDVYTECRYAKCCYAECRGASQTGWRFLFRYFLKVPLTSFIINADLSFSSVMDHLFTLVEKNGKKLHKIAQNCTKNLLATYWSSKFSLKTPLLGDVYTSDCTANSVAGNWV